MVRSPKARLRSVSRCFSSEIEDKGWFHDREGWRRYLDMLATNRFNRVALTFGMPYNYPYQNGYLTDVYLHFAYPFLVAPEGHDVRVRELSDDERADNLETLQFIGREAERRGLEFHLGLWTHGYDFDDTPRANYTIDGITPDNHAAYCRDALHALLVAVPQIRGVTLRVHIEGGVPEASYDFWSVVFQGIARTGRPIEVDLHAKGVEPKLIDTAIRSGLPVNISPKYLAEHMGLPYHQAAIRREESPPEGDVPSAMSFSEGSRRFLRYSYGDLLSRAREYSVSFRIWPGTQRILLWGDPDMAGGYGQLSTIAGATGVEICEPLSYKGRMGSGQPGGRFNYTDGALIPKYDWQKHEIFYRIWGRRLHDAAAEGPELLRLLDTRCGDAADDVAKALTGIGGVLNIVTQAYGPSACNHYYWPEIYDNLSLINPPGQLPYGDDFDQPGGFGNAPTFDPQLFANPAQYATEALADRQSHRYTPLDGLTRGPKQGWRPQRPPKPGMVQTSPKRAGFWRMCASWPALPGSLLPSFAPVVRGKSTSRPATQSFSEPPSANMRRPSNIGNPPQTPARKSTREICLAGRSPGFRAIGPTACRQWCATLTTSKLGTSTPACRCLRMPTRLRGSRP